MIILDEILKWSKKLPPWQSDALRRIWTQDALSESDESDLYQMLKKHHGLIKDDGGAEIPEPVLFAKEHIGSASIHGQRVILKSLRDLKNVNAIGQDQRINFGAQGLTVIFGENAAGKSGYSRVLKKACRARGEPEIIYPNIYNGATGNFPAEATFDIVVESKGDMSVKWQDGGSSPDYLANIAVFDSEVARVYVDEANEVSYIPYGLDVFTGLANLCRNLKVRCQRELDGLPKPPPAILNLIGDGKPIESLNADTSKEDINDWTAFYSKDKDRFAELTKIIADYKANDPKKKAKILRRQKLRVGQLRKELLALTGALSTSAVKELEKLWRDTQTAKAAARIASEKAFSREPLPGTGNDVWKIMFESAKKFSEQCAYPDKKYPVTEKDSRCPLCQQVLSDEAKDRLQRFWEYVQQDTAKTAASKQQELTEKLRVIRTLQLDPFARDLQLLEEIRELSKETAQELNLWLPTLTNRFAGIEKATGNGDWKEIPQFALYPIGKLSGISKQLESLAQKADSLAKPDAQLKLELELGQLNIRKSLYDNNSVFLAHIEMLKQKGVLESCLKAVDTTGITLKQSKLMEQALTKELETALKNELIDLQVDYIPMQLKKIGNVGSTYHRLKLPIDKYDKIELSEILSEGEHRIVAIASFLAELSTSPHDCGIIFDDPVSSLDNRWRYCVARRLVREGKKRQVIIFTHDIVFLLALEREAGLQQIPFTTQTVSRLAQYTGLCNPDLPWDAMNTGKRLGYLRQMHQQLSKFSRAGNEKEYRRQVAEYYGLLRSTWERAIEEVLFNSTVERFCPNIKTQSLRDVTILDEDYVKIDNGMTKCSAAIAAHDKAAAAGSITIMPDELLADLLLLDELVKEVNVRKNNTGEARKKLIKAPRP
jgi:hypothetical protein